MCFVSDFLNKIENEEWSRYDRAVAAMRKAEEDADQSKAKVQEDPYIWFELSPETFVPGFVGPDGSVYRAEPGDKFRIKTKDLEDGIMYTAELVMADGSVYKQDDADGSLIKLAIRMGRIRQIK